MAKDLTIRVIHVNPCPISLLYGYGSAANVGGDHFRLGLVRKSQKLDQRSFTIV